MDAILGDQSPFIRNGRTTRPLHWKEVAERFNATRSYIKVLREYPEAFVDVAGVRVSDGCGRMRCLRWSEDLFNEPLDESSRGDGTDIAQSGCQRKKARKLKLSAGDELPLSRQPQRQMSIGRTRTDRPDFWRDVARFFIESKRFNDVKKQFPDAFLDAAGNPATDSCAKMRVLRWKDDYNIELLEGGTNTSDGVLPAYGNHMDKTLEAACQDLVQRGVCIDESVVQKLLLEELRRSNQSKLQISEGGMSTFGKVWANRFFRRHKFLVRDGSGAGTTTLEDQGRDQGGNLDLKDCSLDSASLAVVESLPTDSAASLSTSSAHNVSPSSSNSGDISSSSLTKRMKDGRSEIWRDVARLFMVCGNYKTVKEQFPTVFNQDEGQPMSDGAGKMLCQQWKEDLIFEHQNQNVTV
jgi:hypothetical protein